MRFGVKNTTCDMHEDEVIVVHRSGGECPFCTALQKLEDAEKEIVNLTDENEDLSSQLRDAQEEVAEDHEAFSVERRAAGLDKEDEDE